MVYVIRMGAQPEYAMLMQSLASFRDDVGFHLMGEPSLPDELAAPLWEAFRTVRTTIDKLASDYGCVESESGFTIYAPISLIIPSDRNGS